MVKELKNEKIKAFLLTFYTANAARDFTQLMQKYMNEQCTGDYSRRLQKVYTDAA